MVVSAGGKREEHSSPSLLANSNLFCPSSLAFSSWKGREIKMGAGKWGERREGEKEVIFFLLSHRSVRRNWAWTIWRAEVPREELSWFGGIKKLSSPTFNILSLPYTRGAKFNLENGTKKSVELLASHNHLCTERFFELQIFTFLDCF